MTTWVWYICTSLAWWQKTLTTFLEDLYARYCCIRQMMSTPPKINIRGMGDILQLRLSARLLLIFSLVFYIKFENVSFTFPLNCFGALFAKQEWTEKPRVWEKFTQLVGLSHKQTGRSANTAQEPFPTWEIPCLEHSTVLPETTASSLAMEISRHNMIFQWFKANADFFFFFGKSNTSTWVSGYSSGLSRMWFQAGHRITLKRVSPVFAFSSWVVG